MNTLPPLSGINIRSYSVYPDFTPTALIDTTIGPNLILRTDGKHSHYKFLLQLSDVSTFCLILLHMKVLKYKVNIMFDIMWSIVTNIIGPPHPRVLCYFRGDHH